MAYNNRRRRNKKPQIEDNYIPPFSAEKLALNITSLNLNPKTIELLSGAGLNTILDLVKRQERDLYKIKTFNKKNLFDVKDALRKENLHLKPMPLKQDEIKVENTNVAKDSNRLTNNLENKNKNNKFEQNQKDNRGRNRYEKTSNGFVNESEKATKQKRERQRPQKTRVEYTTDIYVKIKKNGKWGFMDREGKEIVEARYDDVFSYKDELCCVELNEKYGYIDRVGNFVIEPQYDLANSFSEGMACVYKGDKCGYIDKENNIIINFEYDCGTQFVDGNCRVKKDEKWGELYFVEDEDGIRRSEVRWII